MTYLPFSIEELFEIVLKHSKRNTNDLSYVPGALVVKSRDWKFIITKQVRLVRDLDSASFKLKPKAFYSVTDIFILSNGEISVVHKDYKSLAAAKKGLAKERRDSGTKWGDLIPLRAIGN